MGALDDVGVAIGYMAARLFQVLAAGGAGTGVLVVAGLVLAVIVVGVLMRRQRAPRRDK